MANGVEWGQLHKKSVLKDLNGNIINLLDETNGGWIVRNRQVVNQEKWDALVKKEHDRQVAAKAITEQVASPMAEQRAIAPNPQVKSDLEKRVDDMESTLQEILKAVKK